ncbi:STAS/SEC14 domain-containing protein [Oricola nitratireducens]|jgi:hypothetical protein|uniref:STAS/SEC14 domain-containing protein n=1 Tax=Oricola nitratireducens TaxID=2775868 RepID=UPI001868BE40|nr:STAS/SEC14 domain-containing protein [Oricola nitratireducens]
MNETVTAASIRPLATDRDDLYAFEVVGRLNADDVRDTYAILMDAYDRHGTIDLMVTLEKFDGFEWRAAFEDTTRAAKTRSLKHIRRYAVVGGPGWIRSLVELFDPLFHVEMRTFGGGEEEKALAWLNEK